MKASGGNALRVTVRILYVLFKEGCVAEFQRVFSCSKQSMTQVTPLWAFIEEYYTDVGACYNWEAE